MATHPVDTSAPLDVLLATIPSLPRPVLSRLTARLIERLDEIDGDPDEEQTDDEGEPNFAKPPQGYGPGCAISDPDFGIEDMPEGRGDDCASVDHRPIADPQAYREHRNRIRQERCYRLRGGWPDWRLYTEPTTPTKRQILRRKRGVPRRPRA